MKHNNKITKKIERLINDHIIVPFEEKAKNFDPRFTETFNYELEQDLQSRIDAIPINPETIKSAKGFIKEILTIINIEEIEKKNLLKAKKWRQELIASDERASLLFELMEEADKVTPYISYFILARINPIESNKKISKVWGKKIDCEGTSGELRAERVAAYYQEVAEQLYGNYIRIIWELSRVIKGEKRIISYQNFGNLINALKSKKNLSSKYQPLIDFDIAWFRNALTHKERKYLPPNDAFLCWNSKNTENRLETICINCLEEIAEDNFWMTGECFPKIMHLYLIEKIGVETGMIRFSFKIVEELTKDTFDEQVLENHFANWGMHFIGTREYQFIRSKAA